ncbi:hypothetical protein LPJ79_004322 [Coemansia sp. RSA 1821]|nr:hypothetical protein LPJ79_004322 [Coemansia sp. RSA 1821]
MSSQIAKVCKLASQAETREDVVVSIVGNDVFSLPVKTEFQHLTRMNCYSPVYLGTLINVVRLVPSLIVLKCFYVIAESSDDLCGGGSQISELFLMFSVQQPDTDEWTIAVQNMVLKLTKLKSLTLHGFPTALLYSLVDTHSTGYPHLSSITWNGV